MITTDHVTNTSCNIIVLLYIFACSRHSIIERLQTKIFGTKSGKNIITIKISAHGFLNSHRLARSILKIISYKP